mmetsp:Transcript_456/g.1074  ORF Transcript_456/g.1074 Transcript_456/m.1074 type:complete len:109 (-) Transcript_456:1744-2070(-)
MTSFLITSSSKEWINPDPAWFQDGGTYGNAASKIRRTIPEMPPDVPLTIMEQQCMNGSIFNRLLFTFDSVISSGYGTCVLPTSGTPIYSSTRYRKALLASLKIDLISK